jgi:hypothetical protein
MATLFTNILALPLVQASIETGTNEDWIDSIRYLVDPDDDAVDPVDWPQLDLRGINFEMEIRRSPTDHEVILNASIVDGTLAIGAPPNFGFLLINVPLHDIKHIFAGEYVGDIRASVGAVMRIAIQIELTIIEGVTKSP